MDAFREMCYALPFQALSTSSIADIDEARAAFNRAVDERVDAKLAKTRVVWCRYRAGAIGGHMHPVDCPQCGGSGFRLEVLE